MLKGQPSFDQGVFLLHLQKGKEYFDRNQLQSAREELEAARLMRPRDEKVLNMLGMTYFKLDMLSEAEEMYMSLAANNPDIYTLQSNLGLIQLKLEKLNEAKDSLIRALELQPTNPKAHFYLGLLYEKQELWEDAFAHFEHARADKMAAKMKGKIEEEKNKREEVLPFHIVEVLAEAEQKAQEIYQQPETPKPLDEEEPFELPPAPETEEPVFPEILAEEEANVDVNASTLKISSQQLQETMEKIREEVVQENEAATPEFSSEVILFPSPAPQESREEEEQVFPDSTPELPEIIEEPRVEESEPVMESEPEPEEPVVPVSIEPGSAASMNGSFFLMEEMAGDISTFLAQSRDEVQSTEEVLYEEAPQISILRVEKAEQASAEEELFESRIPTPEEVENQTQDIGAESLFESPVENLTINPEPISDTEAEAAEKIELQPEAVPEAETETREGVFDEVASTSAVSEQIETAQIETMQEESQPQVEVPSEIPPAPANLDQFTRERFYVQPLIGTDRFLLIDPHLLEIIISEKLICRMGTISSYTGNLQFSPWQSAYGETIPLIQTSGSGILFLADRRKEIFIISLNNETIYAEANHLLVAQSTLNVEVQLFQEKPPARDVFVLKISGRGTLALNCQTKPLTLKVHDNLPVNIPSDALMAWSGNLNADLIQDTELRRVMMTPDEQTSFLRFTGSGDVVVEQGSLWGDRRSTRRT